MHKMYRELDINFDFLKNHAHKIRTDKFLSSQKSQGTGMLWIDENQDEFTDVVKFTDNIAVTLNCMTARSCYTTQLYDHSHIPVHVDFDDTKQNDTHHSLIYSLIVPIIGSGITTFYNLHPDDLGPEKTDWKQRHDVLYDSYNDVSKKLTVKEQITITKPTILCISYPHSVTVIESPRVTYHLKLLGCKDNIDTIAQKLNNMRIENAQ